MFAVRLFMCGFVCLVKSQNQFQQYQSYPYGTSYASIYGKQPIIVTPTSSYNQVYPGITVQRPSIYPETNHLQDTYLSNILLNPAIQAFIDPGTKIYNQNGVEISDQVRPKTSNVVNNYFIVPTDYLKTNDTHSRFRNQNNYYRSRPKSYLRNEQGTRETRSEVSKDEQKKRKSQSQIQQCSATGEGKKQKNVEGTEVIFADITNNKQRDSFKREDNTSTRQHSEKSSKKSNNINNDERLVRKNRKNKKDEPKVKFESNLNECDEGFYMSEECCELDKRNPRNPDNKVNNKKSHTKSTKNQNDFMKDWMNYVKRFMPDQNDDSLDFSHIHYPFNFDQMNQMPFFNNIKPQVNKSNKRNKKRKQKEQPVEVLDKSDIITEERHKIVELYPKFIEEENIKEPVNIKKVTNTIPEALTSVDSPPNNEANLQKINSELSVEEPNMYQNEIIDYYPDFKNDVIYATDEDDLYFIHNRHYYNTEEALNRERRKFDRGEDFKQFEKIRDIPLKDKIEDNFRIPPGLSDPGFQTRKINVKDKSGFYSYYIDKDSTDFIPVEKDDNNIETVFARSKVVKYGKPREVEKQKIDLDQKNRNEKHRNHPKDGDTTIVYSKAWNS